MSSKGRENALLSKWSLGPSPGLSGSSLSSSLLSSNLTGAKPSSLLDTPPKKRKPEREKDANIAEKKTKQTGSSLLGSYSTGLLGSSKGYGKSTVGLGLTSSLTSGSTLQKPKPSHLESSSRSSLLSSSLMSSSLSTGTSLGSLGKSQSAAGAQVSLLQSGSGFTSSSKLLSSGLQGISLGSASAVGSSHTGVGMSTRSSMKSSFLQSSMQADTKEKVAHAGEKRKRQHRDRTIATSAMRRHETDAPEYDLSEQVPSQGDIHMPKFTPPEKDTALVISTVKVHDVNGIKFALLNAVSGSLICQPKFKDTSDPTRIALVTMSERVIFYDPEFILKLALYTRRQLNIRTTGNFLLAMASHMPVCRPYLKKYFKPSIALPSDWIEVAEIYQAFPDKALPLGALPSALRRVMVAKFPDFDKYQLAKYNKEGSKKKKNKQAAKKGRFDDQSGGRGRGRGRGGDRVWGRGGRGQPPAVRGRGRGGAQGRSALDWDSDSTSSSSDSDSDLDSDAENESMRKWMEDLVYDEEESHVQLQQMSFTLKQLIRKLHITEPVEHVMCLIGKKYPKTSDEFYQSRLPGTFEEERAGKRMKLPIPETWETQVSLKGNKASTWEQLLDHKKLPFMAMLRNLRNLIRAGISPKHHNWVIRKLTDERAVVNSKQFPFRFFSAYEVLEQLLVEYETSQNKIVAEAVAGQDGHARGGRGGGRGRGRGRGSRGGSGAGGEKQWWIEKRAKKLAEKNKTKETPFDTALITRYRKALDTAVKIATVYNVQPIRGRTVILCDTGPSMEVPCSQARGLGKPRTMKEVGVLLGLMCKYSCEECAFVTFDANTRCYSVVELDRGTILDNMARVISPDDCDNSYFAEFINGLPMSVLGGYLQDRIQIDNLLVMTGGGEFEAQRTVLASFMEKYRRLVNPDLLYVNVAFAGKSTGFPADIKPEHDNNIYISGYSDQILRFIAERGDGGQLLHVEKIDEAFKLTSIGVNLSEKKPAAPLAPAKPLALTALTPRWRTARVFISSTFRDMHGERDLLTRFVFPELRALGKKQFINVYEVDLRWGVTEEATRSNKTLELCLTEVAKCQLFVALLGERYGWVPDSYTDMVPDTEEFDWLKTYPPGASVTELEIYRAALSRAQDMLDKAFFFFRDPQFEKDVPKIFEVDFLVEHSRSKERMDELKRKIRKSGLEFYENYPCGWGGVVEGKPLVAGLEQFGARVLNNLWNALRKLYPQEEAMLDEACHINKLHEAFVENRKSQFVGRIKVIKDLIRKISDIQTGVIGVVGKPGTGKSSLLAKLVTDYQLSKFCDSLVSVVVHVVGAAPGSTNIHATLRRLCHDLNSRFSLQMTIPEDYKNLVGKFEELLKEAGSLCGSPLVIFIDGLDLMEPAYHPHGLTWLPATLPKNVVVVMTAVTGGKVAGAFKHRQATEVVVEGLDMWDKADMVRSSLQVHRKCLDESPFNNQLKVLTSKKEGNVPLYLKLACEELRVFGLFEKMGPKLKSLPQTVPTLLQGVLARLESDLGRDLVATSLALLVCARDGLESGELHDLLSLKSVLQDSRPKVMEIVNMQLTPEEKLTSSTMSQLERALEGFLNPTETWNSRLSLAHADIEAAVRQRYMKGSQAAEEELFLHRLLAAFFYTAADVSRDGLWKGKSDRAFKELPYHLSRSGSFAELENVITNLWFVYSKCMLGLAPHLLLDYQAQDVSSKVLEREQNKFLEKVRVKEYRSFVSRSLYILSSHPALTWQQATNELAGSIPAVDVATIMGTSNVRAEEKCYMQWDTKPAQVDPCYMTLSNLTQPITSVCVSPDNKYFACGGLDCVVHLYEFATGKEVKTFCGHSDVVTDVCFAGTRRLCSTSCDTNVCIWDVADGHRLFTLTYHQRRVNACTADNAGKVLATAGWDSTIRVWSVYKGEQLCEFKVGSPVNSVSFHPEGQLLVCGCWDSTIKIWDIFHKTKKAVLRGHKSSVRDVAYSPSGRHIASAALDGDVKLWAAFTGSQVGNVRGHSLPINKLMFSPTGQELITVSDDHKVKVWSGHLGKLAHCFGSEENGPAVCVAISPGQDCLAVGYHEGHVRLFDIQTGFQTHCRRIHSASVRCLKFINKGNHLFTGSNDTSAKMLDMNLNELSVLQDHTKPVMCVDSCRDFIATSSEDCTCILYENPSKSYWGTSTNLSATKMCVVRGHIAPVTSCAFSDDGTKLATGSRDMSVRIYDLIELGLNPDGDVEPRQILHDCHADWVSDFKWSNTGDFIVTASTDFNLKVWEVKTGTEKYKLTGHMGAVNQVGYRYGCIVSTCADGSVKVWSHKGVEITTLYGHTQRAVGCDIAVDVVSETGQDSGADDWADNLDDGKGKGKTRQPKVENVLVATCSDDGTARLWYPLEANEISSLTGHSDKVTAVGCSTDGQLCTSSLDKSIKLWSHDSKVSHMTESHDAPVTFVSSVFDKHGAIVLSGSRDGVIKLWKQTEGSSKSDASSYTCVFKLKAHPKAVTCGCWVGAGGQYVVTGSNDGIIYIWEVVRLPTGAISLRKKAKWTTESPVQALVWNAQRPASNIFFSVHLNGMIMAWNDKNKMGETKTSYSSYDEWLLQAQVLFDDRLYVTTTDGCVCQYDINSFYTARNPKDRKQNKFVKKDALTVPRDQVDKDIPAHKQTQNWVYCLAGDRKDVWMGDSRGQLSLDSPCRGKSTKKIHAGAITNVLKHRETIFTTSTDKTLKVWDSNLNQVGQFYCPSPVSSMAVLHDEATLGRVPVVYGDQLGNIHFLSWQTGR